MNKRRMVSIVSAAAIMATAAISVSAAELTNLSPDGDTEVKAKVLAADPGDVSYVISIPDLVDFETLQIPENTDTDHNKDKPFTVEAIEINNLDENKRVNVYVKGSTSSSGNEAFTLDQIGGSVQLTYDVYTTTDITDVTSALNTGVYGANGFFYVGFEEAGQKVEGTLRINQNQLKEKKDGGANVVGEYKGYMTFHSEIA